MIAASPERFGRKFDMKTLNNLERYSSALQKWAAKKRRYDYSVEIGKPEKKPLESEPLPSQFEIGAGEIEWAEKIRRKILAPKPIEPTLDEQLKNKIKMPERKSI